MSYRHAFFAVPASVSLEDTIAPFVDMADELRSENDYEDVYLVASEVGGLRLLYLAAEPAPRGRVSRGFFTDRWSGGPLFVVVYDDQHGIFLWEHRPGGRPRQSILSDRGRAGFYKLEPTVPTEDRDAISIGLEQFGFTANRNDFVKLLHATTAWALLHRPPGEVPLPRGAGPIVDSYIDEHEWSPHGLPVRSY